VPQRTEVVPPRRNQLGVTFHMALATVMCFNGDNHGFIIGKGRYKVL
jgi:hypothetical protein